MEPSINDNRLYRQLKRCKADIRRNVIIYSAVFLLLTVLGILCCFGVYQNEGLESAVGFALFYLIIEALYIFSGLRKLKKIIFINRKKWKRVSSLSASELSALEAQTERTEFLYKTFYMLDEFLYVPKIKLLIRYSEIRGFVNVIHKSSFYNREYCSIKDGMRIEITDKDGLVYKTWVKQWKKYEKDYRSIAETIYNKIESSERNIAI